MPSPDDHKTAMSDDHNMGPAQQGGGYDNSANTRNAANDTAMRQSDNMGSGNTNMTPTSGDNMHPMSGSNFHHTSGSNFHHTSGGNFHPMSGDNMNPTGGNTMSSTGDQMQSSDTHHTYGKNAADKIESMLHNLANKITGHKK